METSVSVRVSILSVLTLSAAIPARSQALPDGKGKQLVQMACTRCHGVDKFTVERHTHDDWAEEVVRPPGPSDEAHLKPWNRDSLGGGSVGSVRHSGRALAEVD